jgi:glycosyltransferase involved in cell wall biosynthesis
MHILLIHQAFAALDEPGGTRHHEIARYLVAQGHQVTVITGQVSYLTGERIASGWLHKTVDDVGVEIWRCYSYPAWHRSFSHRLLNFISFMLSACIAGLRARGVDLVWGTSPPLFQGLAAWAVAKLRGRKFLFEVRDLWPYFAVAVGVLRHPILIRLSEGLERFLYRRSDHVVVNSPGYIDHVCARGARAVELVPNGVDVSMFDPSEEGVEFRRMHDLEGKFLALYAGAHGISNDLAVLLSAAERLSDVEDLVIVFLGDGKEKAGLMASAEEAGIENVRFLPPLSKAEMPKALAAADLCIAILKPIEAYKTTYPNKVFDYMAVGRPVILAIDGVIREVVERAGAGLFAAPGDPEALARAIRRLKIDPDTRAIMGKSGRAFVEQHFDRRASARKMGWLMVGMLGADGSGNREARAGE